MEKVEGRLSDAHLDFMVIAPNGDPIVVSYFDRSMQLVRKIGASMTVDGIFSYENRRMKNESHFSVSYATITKGKEKFTHAIAVANNCKSYYLVTTEEDCHQDLFNYLMNHYDYPILKEWIPVLFEEFRRRNILWRNYKGRVIGDGSRMFVKNGRAVPITDLVVYGISLPEPMLKDTLSNLLQSGRIWIAEEPQQKLVVENMDEYFQRYGKSIVDNLKQILHPVTGLNGEIQNMCLNTMQLYPQQAAMVNGVHEYLKHKRKGYVLFSMGTGSGKTIQAASAAEMLYVDRYLRSHKGTTLADAYAEDGVINYRHIIMCPGHLVEKWRYELLKEIPYAKPVIIDSFSQLIKLREAGKERKDGKEFYILSKDFLKLSYQQIPTPKKQARKRVSFFKCKDCGAIQNKRRDTCGYCDSPNIEIIQSKYVREGMCCPNCNRLLYKNEYLFDPERFQDPEDMSTWPLQPYDFAAEKTSNESCVYCGEPLWMPFVKNINCNPFGNKKEPSWIRQTFWSNKAHKGKTTKWVLRGQEAIAERLWGEPTNSMDDSEGGCRKYSPAAYIKKYLKGYFDVFVADEVHKAKGGSTAQGNAFHALVKASRYTFGLTGTIAGGVATDLFYLLYRLEPSRMKAHGYNWGDIMKFARTYGVIEETFYANVDVRRNKFSRGKQLIPPRVLPGISPKIFSDFLLDRAVFLDIVDMSANMPPLDEQIVLVKPRSDLERQMITDYKAGIDYLKYYARDNQVNLASTMQQFAMSYLDKPYGVEPILNPNTGEDVYYPKDYSVLVADGGLLPKEEKLIELLKKEQSENRNCVVFVEYSQSDGTNVLPRLQKILMDNLGLNDTEVITLTSSTPKASEREKWMHKKAKEGMKIMLCNPRLCETGLDFCWMDDGVEYNYPTLFFYQCGYSLFVTWQAAGRHWRLNQRRECRTYYLAYEGTVQQAILQVLGEKKSATAAIQGHFSAAGLSAMARGVDTQARIAEIMASMDETSGNRLQEMFDVVSDNKGADNYGSVKKMKLFKELIKKVKEEKKENPDLFNDEAFGAFDSIFSKFLREESGEEGEDLFSEFEEMMEQMSDPFTEPKTDSTRKKKVKNYSNCFSLF